jgi:two-component system NtrC family sensor kinase
MGWLAFGVVYSVTVVSVFSLLVARIAAERTDLQQTDGTTRLLTAVIEQAQDLILVLTADGHVRHANLAFCRAVGLARDDLATMPTDDLLARPIASDEIQTIVRRGSTWRGTLTRSRRDGTTFPVSAAVTALMDDHGRPTHVVSVERDISEEKRLKEQLIHTERLSAVGDLIAGVAHELNNPLQSVMGFTELLLRAEERPEVRHDLERVQVDADRAAKIVRNLLAFVRRSVLEKSMIDLSEIVRSTIAVRAFEVQATGICLREEYAADLPMILGSREEIRQVILNLVSNAEHALRGVDGPGLIRVRTGHAGSIVFAEVADNGPGVAPDLAGRIFEPFFTTKDIGQGTGLGLSIGMGLANAHGGSLTLVKTDRGACFRLELPLADTTQCSRDALAGVGAGGPAA